MAQHEANQPIRGNHCGHSKLGALNINDNDRERDEQQIDGCQEEQSTMEEQNIFLRPPPQHKATAVLHSV